MAQPRKSDDIRGVRYSLDRIVRHGIGVRQIIGQRGVNSF